jgi:site-specific recombinase XerD
MTGVTPYKLWHSFAQRASDSGQVAVEVLARMMGHTETTTTAFCFKVRDQRAILAARTLSLRQSKAQTA